MYIFKNICKQSSNFDSQDLSYLFDKSDHFSQKHDAAGFWRHVDVPEKHMYMYIVALINKKKKYETSRLRSSC